MSTVTSTIDIILKDDVSRSAGQVAAALERMEAEERKVAAAFAKTDLRDRFAGQLKALGAGVPHVEAAAAAWARFTREQGLAAKSTDWTKSQVSSVREWEISTRAAIRGVIAEDRQLAKVAEQTAQRRAAAHGSRGFMARLAGGHGGGGFDLGGTIAGAVAAHSFISGMEGVLDTYREFDKEKRYGKVVMGLTDEQQRPLVDQAIHGGATTKFNDIQWLEAQRELAARGYQLDQVKAFAPITADLGAAFDRSMPEAVKLLEGAMLGFGKDVSTYEKAVAAARRTADMEVKASKISGMTAEDIEHLYKFGAAPARMARISEESLLMFGAISKKANLGGDEAGTAFRGMTTKLIAPDAGAKVAMRTAGIDFSAYQKMPKTIDVDGFSAMVAQKYGVQLSAEVKAGLGKVFSDEKLLGNASAFMPAVISFLRDSLGGTDAKSLKSIAGLAGSFRDKSSQGVDTNALLRDLIPAMAKNPALANAIFGGKVGGKVYAALGDPDLVAKITDALIHHADGFAGQVASARMAGFDGAMSMLEGSWMNLKSSIGRAIDNGGEGSGGFLTMATRAAARFTQALAETDPKILGLGTAVAGVVSLWGAGKMVGLFTGATALKGSAFALDRAAAHLMRVNGQGGGHTSGGGEGGGARGGGWWTRGAKAGGYTAADGMPGVAAVPGAVELGAAVVGGAVAAAVVETVKKSFAAQAPGQGGLWAAPTPATEESDRMNLSALEAERAEVAKRIADQVAQEKLPGTSDVATAADRARMAQLDAAIGNLRKGLDNLFVSPDREAARGNAMSRFGEARDLGLVDDPYVDREAERGNAYRRLIMPPVVPPASPPLPPRNSDGNALRHGDAAPRPADDGTHALDGFVMGQLTPKVDTSAIDAAGAKASEVGEQMKTALNVTASPQINMASIAAAQAGAERLVATLRQAGSLAASASAAVAEADRSGRPGGASLASRARARFASAPGHEVS